jgi:hypothetical protein
LAFWTTDVLKTNRDSIGVPPIPRMIFGKRHKKTDDENFISRFFYYKVITLQPVLVLLNGTIARASGKFKSKLTVKVISS